jgi:hypothetical protein
MGEATYGDKRKKIEIEPMEATKTKKEEDRN